MLRERIVGSDFEPDSTVSSIGEEGLSRIGSLTLEIKSSNSEVKISERFFFNLGRNGRRRFELFGIP